MLCSSPLADSRLPTDFPGASEEGSNAWFREMEGVMTNMALNTVNHYGTDGSYYSQFGNYFETYQDSANGRKPLLISEYGVDAYQSWTNAPSETCNPPPCLVMGENDASRTSQVSRPATPHDKGCNRIRAACDHMCAACNRM